MAYDLPFEKPLADLEAKIFGLLRKKHLTPEEQTLLQTTEQELQRHTQDLYSHLSSWQKVQVARHKDRPHAIDFIRLMCDEFFELHGDRSYGDNPSIIGGPAQFDGQTVMFICQEKGRTTKERQHHNAGQPHPEGFRKAHRLLQQAEKFGFPVISLIDTPGASIMPDQDEVRGQSTSIAENLFLLARLRTPVVAAIIGEGGSGGALALGLADRVLMLEHSYYATASPESASLIVWRHEKHANLMAEGMQINAQQLLQHGFIDAIVPEPLGGAHRDHHKAAANLRRALEKHLAQIQHDPIETLLEQRYRKFRQPNRPEIAEFARVTIGNEQG